MKKLAVALFVFALFSLTAFSYINPFRAPGSNKQLEIVTIDSDNYDVASVRLFERGFIKSLIAFDIARSLQNKQGKIQPGGYYLSKNMDAWTVLNKISGKPDLKWVTVLEGMRKEQIGENLKETFNWDDGELDKWNNTYTAMKFDYIEGVYFPDTYLIPVKDSGLKIANRMINNFNEKMVPLFPQFEKKDILWTSGIKLASIVQREAADSRDMPLIAGILWNRLLVGQKLQVDATIQYAKGKTDGVWWSVVTASDIQNIDSLYNTYKHSGLPPHPISNPGIDAIKSVLNPQETDCLYYLHDHKSQIHCAKTYEEHLENIKKFLN
ncbi:MAG TPA: endolytic transglycosylase MltG [Ignavibacteria bacterium]